jgi:hypothetical protein
MMPEQLWTTTMDPTTRTLKLVSVEGQRSQFPRYWYTYSLDPWYPCPRVRDHGHKIATTLLSYIRFKLQTILAKLIILYLL